MKSKNFITIIFLVILPFCINAQNKVGQTMPNVMMRLINGEVFNSNTLPKDKPIVLFYFSTDCEHCEKLTQSLFANKKILAGKNVIMVTFFSMNEIIAFAQKNKIQNLSNVYIGSEGNRFVVPKFFNIQQFPFIALLDSHQKIVQTFNSKSRETDILKAVSGKW